MLVLTKNEAVPIVVLSMQLP